MHVGVVCRRDVGCETSVCEYAFGMEEDEG